MFIFSIYLLLVSFVLFICIDSSFVRVKWIVLYSRFVSNVWISPIIVYQNIFHSFTLLNDFSVPVLHT